MAKSAQAKYRTPAGIFSYPHLNKPDTKFDKEGKFKVDLYLTRDKARDLSKTAKEVAKEEWGPAKLKDVHMPYSVSEDDPDMIMVRATAKAEYPPTLADVAGNKINRAKCPLIGSGTKGKLSLRLKANEVSGKMFITAYLLGAQIINLVEYGEDTGFGSAEDDLDDDEEGFNADKLGSEDDDDEAGFGTLVNNQSADADAGEYEDDEDNLEDDDEDEDF